MREHFNSPSNMSGYNDILFVNSLKKESEARKPEDLQIIYSYLHGLEALSSLREASLRTLCKSLRYEFHEANEILYCRGQLSTCWYILLSGSVFIDGSMFLPRTSFGKRSGGGRRMNECLILEPSEMIVVDYPEGQLMRPGQRQSCTTMNLEKLLALEQEEVAVAADGHDDHLSHQIPLQLDLPYIQNMLHRGEVLLKSSRSSHSSDTSSAYSGSDTMQSVQSSLEDQEVDFTGLTESMVDSDEEEELADSIDSLTVRDTVRECLDKEPADRTEDDIEILLEFMQHLPAFANLTLTVRRALCAVMVFAVVDKASTIVMNDKEELDSWSVIVNGHVEVVHSDGTIQELHLGDSFGVSPTMDKMFHQGVMRTKVDDCQFVCIAQSDYYRILHQGEENTRKHEEDGQVVLVTEHRSLDSGSRRGHVVIRGTSERLMSQLVEENPMDPSYVEDFLLTQRTFVPNALFVANMLLEWFEDAHLRDKVTRVVLLWVNNHFTDFETDPEMMEFLEKFEAGLEKEKMQGQLRLLNIACATKARSRTITLARSNRDEPLHFTILGGYERGFGIFISKVDKSSKSEEVGLKRGDQILEVNGQSFEHVSQAKALEILKGSTHLSITVRSNLLVFKEMLNTPDTSPRCRGRKASEIARLQPDPRARLSSSHLEWNNVVGLPIGVGGYPLGVLGVGSTVFPPGSPPVKGTPGVCIVPTSTLSSNSTGDCKKDDKKGFMTLGHKARLKKALAKINIIPKALNNETPLNSSDDSLYPGSTTGGHQNCRGNSPLHSGSSTGSNGTGILYHSHSNPDLTALPAFYEHDFQLDFPEHVLKVYRADQTCKYLLIHKETTAREVVMLSLREFGITDSSSNYSLCEVTVGEGGVIKQRRLPDQMQNLAERIGLNSRYFLKNNSSQEALVTDDMAPLLRESQVHFLQLNSVEVATQLTLEDFSIFRQIEPTEYIDDLFEVKSKYGTPMLAKFAELVNREMFWVVSEICGEPNILRRMKIIKHFIKVARQCKECKNFNSMFAILSGLGHRTVSRLRLTWEKLPTKYLKMFEDLQDLMDPSRNMCKYRNLINSEHTQPPIIPFYPVVKKDLTFINLGNDTFVDHLVNFEKLRMIAKEVRSLMNMCSAPYDLFSMLELGGAHLSAAMASLNSFVTATNAATVKRRKKSTAQPNTKKMFEEAQMVRRVKAYLSNLKVITDEEKLREMSMECEPVTGPMANAMTAQPRKRHPSPTLSTASSTSSTSEGKKSINSGPKFGADSPQAVRKLLSLSDQTKIRPHQPPRHHHSLSPSPSPNAHRKRSDIRPVQGHGRSHSDTVSAVAAATVIAPAVMPVDLSAESSSVTTLNNMPLRKSHTSGSVTSTDSCGSYHNQHSHFPSHPPPLPPHSLPSSHSSSSSYDTDSGHAASFDSHSISSISSNNSPPPAQRRSLLVSHSPPTMRIRPPFPHAVPVLPAIIPGLTPHAGNLIMPPPPPPGPLREGGVPFPPVRSRKPPDYMVAAQMAARNRQMARLGRAHSHEGVTTNYYNSDATDPEEDDEDETQVSAV